MSSESRKLSTTVFASYGAGWIGGQVFRDVPALVLVPFMTTILGVPPALAGAAIFIPKLWVVICDPLMGLLSDRTRTRWGRRRPFLLAGSILCGITFLLLFNVPSLPSGPARGLYIGLMYVLASTAFSIYSVPYLTLASELSEDYHERTVIMSWRQMGLGLGLVAGNAMPLWLVSQGGGGETGFQFMAWILAAICFATMFATFAGTGSVPLSEHTQAAVPLREQVRLAVRNKPFLILMAANFAQLVGGAGGYATIAMFFFYVLKKDLTFLSTFLLIMAVTAMIIPPLWTALSRRIGKLAVFQVSIVVFMLNYVSMYFATPDDGTMAIMLRAVGVAIGNGGFSLVAFSMLLDTIAYDRRVSGLNREGVFSGLWSAMDKSAFALGAMIAGLMLSASGFVEGTTGFAPQSADAIRGIQLIYCGTTIFGGLIAMALMAVYPLKDDRGAALG